MENKEYDNEGLQYILQLIQKASKQLKGFYETPNNFQELEEKKIPYPKGLESSRSKSFKSQFLFGEEGIREKIEKKMKRKGLEKCVDEKERAWIRLLKDKT